MNGSNPVHPTTTVVAKRDQMSTELGGEAVVLDLATGIYYGLNETGARVWSLLSAPTTAREICRSIEAEYEVDTDTCTTTVLELLGALVNAGLVEVHDEPA